jgi:hypothetical protein
MSSPRFLDFDLDGLVGGEDRAVGADWNVLAQRTSKPRLVPDDLGQHGIAKDERNPVDFDFGMREREDRDDIVETHVGGDVYAH